MTTGAGFKHHNRPAERQQAPAQARSPQGPVQTYSGSG